MPKAGQGQTTFYTARKDRPPSKFAGRLRIRGYRLHMWLCVQWSVLGLVWPLPLAGSIADMETLINGSQLEAPG